MGKRGRPPHPDILTPREWEVLVVRRLLARRASIGISLLVVGLALACSRTSQGGSDEREAEGTSATAEPTPFVVATDIWVVDADGSDPQRLTNLETPILAGYSVAPAWSPDGARIAFFAGSGSNYAESGHLYVMNSDGTNVSELAPASFDYTRSSWCESDRSPVWSPDGTRLAYQASNQVFVVNPDTGETYGDFPASSFDPAWSPDGTMLAYSAGVFQCSLGGYSFQGDSAAGLASRLGQDASWSPDGKQLAYVESGKVMVADADGRNGRKVAEVNLRGESLQPYNLQWSPDAARLSYMYYGSDTYTTLIYMVDVTSESDPTGLGNPDHRIYDWSPDGSTIVYQVQEDDSCHYPDVIYTRNADGSGEPRRIVRGTSPSWSPDGRKIVFIQEALPDTCPTPFSQY